MSKYTSLVELYTDIANAIREKDGTDSKIYAYNFANKIRNLGEELKNFLTNTSTTYFELEEIPIIRDYAFYGSPFEEIRLDDNGDYPTLGSHVFENSKLKKYVAPLNNTETSYGHTTFNDACFKNCTGLTIVQLRRVGQNMSFMETDLFYNTPIGGLVTTTTTINSDTGEEETIETVAEPTGYIYIPSKNLNSYTSKYPEFRFRAIEDYSVDGTALGELDPDKIAATEVNE